MSTAPYPRLITVDEFDRLAGDSGAELIDGVIVDRPVPNKDHQQVRLRVLELLRPMLTRNYLVFPEFEFRPKPEYTMPRADIAAVRRDRWRQVSGAARLAGAPELHVEILSPTNTAQEIRFKRRLSLTHGALQFWIIDPAEQTIDVTTQDGVTREFRIGQSVSLEAFGAGELEVDAIFVDLENVL